MTDDDKAAKLSQQLVMTPQLQMAIRMLSMTQAELFAMVDDWRAKHPGAIADLAPGEPDPAEEDPETAEALGMPVFTFLAEPPLPAIEPRPDVWVFGNPPQARANPAAVPRIKAVFDDVTLSRSAADVREASWLARAVRQRARTIERLVATLVSLQPQIAIATEPDQLAPANVREVAEAMGLHESTVKRVAPVTSYQTIHGVVQLVLAKSTITHRGL